jgi:hypothetical protein
MHRSRDTDVRFPHSCSRTSPMIVAIISLTSLNQTSQTLIMATHFNSVGSSYHVGILDLVWNGTSVVLLVERVVCVGWFLVVGAVPPPVP